MCTLSTDPNLPQYNTTDSSVHFILYWMISPLVSNIDFQDEKKTIVTEDQFLKLSFIV